MDVQEKPKQKANCDVWFHVDVDVTIGIYYILIGRSVFKEHFQLIKW